MKARCLNPRNRDYARYGGAGVKIAERWLGADGFKNFVEDLGERPPGKTLDRIDPSGDYTPEGCRWATPAEQRANQRPRRRAAS